jgi:FixJ family two-component response regulator
LTGATSHPIFIVDDDPSVLTAQARMLREEGFSVETFASAEAFLARPPGSGCLVLDVSMPGVDGLELQRRLALEGQSLPIVFVTGHGDIPMSVRAMKAGATDFLTKPVPAQVLVAAIRDAIGQDDAVRRARGDSDAFRDRLAGLTPREREVLEALAAGQAQQADCRGSGCRRADGQVPSRAHHGTHAREDDCGTHAHRRSRRGRRRVAPPSGAESLDH